MGELERDDSGGVEQDVGKRGAGAGGDISESEIVTGDKNRLRRDDANVIVNIGPQKTVSGRGRGRLMPEVEQELRGNISELTKAIIRLEGVVDKNNTLSSVQIEAIREQVKAMREQAETTARHLSSLTGMGIITPTRPVPRWMPYAMIIFLAIIAVSAVSGLLYLFVGGG